MHKGGLSLRLLNFSKKVTFQQQKISFYRDIETSEALNDFLSYFLIDKLGCRFNKRPVFENIGSFYAFASRQASPSEQHAITDCFFSHMYVYEREDGDYPVVYLIKIENSYFITPLFREELSYPKEILCSITKKDLPFVFEQMATYHEQPFSWQIKNAWISGLLEHVQDQGKEKVLILAKLDSIRKFLCGTYEEFLKEFKIFPCTRGENSQQLILNYLTLVYEFLKV